MRNPIGSIPLAGPLTIFVLGGLLGLAASYDWRLSAAWLIWLGVGGLVYVAVERLARSPAGLRRAAAALAVIAALYAFVPITQYRHLAFEPKFHLITALGQTLSAPFPPLISTYVDDNAVGGFLGIALPLCVALLWTAPGWRRGLYLLCTLLVGLGLLLAAARGAWVGCAVAAGLALLGAWERRMLARRTPVAAPVDARRWRAVAVVAGVALTVAAVVVLSRGAVLLSAAETRADSRFTLYRNAFLLALNFLFSGIGPGGTFGLVYSRFQLLILSPYLGYAHNLPLGIWLAQGVLGLLGFGALLLTSFRLIRRRMIDPQEANPALRWAAALGCTVALLHGLTDAPQYDTAWPITLLLFAMLALALAAPPEQQRLAWLRPSRRTGLALAGAAALALILSGPRLAALAQSNLAAVTQSRALLTPGLDDAAHLAGLQAAASVAAAAQATDPASGIAAARRGALALELGDFAAAVPALELAQRALPADQSVRKALGYAYVWEGRIAEGVTLFRSLERAEEVRRELDTWQVAWQQRDRQDLAARALAAARLMDAA